MGGDGITRPGYGDAQGFQSTPPRGGRRGAFWTRERCERFQSTPPRGGRRAAASADRGGQCVSIHAPAWGATGFDFHGLRHHDVSIHAPAWGATRHGCPFIRQPNVSIHAPAWGATSPLLSSLPYPGVSIHAPAWGATKHSASCSWRRKSFNPRPRVGGDATPTARVVMYEKFQSTPPRGGRQIRGDRVESGD